MTYTKLFSLLFALLFSISAANAIGVLLLDGIDSGRMLSSDNVSFTFEERFSPETLIILTVKRTDGRFVKELTLNPSVSRSVKTSLSNGRYVVKEYNVATGKAKNTYFTVR